MQCFLFLLAWFYVEFIVAHLESFNKRRTRITKLLDELKERSNGSSIMNILSVDLHRARPEEQPLVATILLQLDLMVFQSFDCFLHILNGSHMMLQSHCRMIHSIAAAYSEKRPS